MNSEERKRFLDKLTRISTARGEEPITKTIPFVNSDVPNYLKRLDEFERSSRDVVLTANVYDTGR
ncbi:hypothetical protein J4402_05215 [Candidatus Pacearchaeota archaeon]|nr:hypothetical protein [Candidatus Pacearchaeota archaeon]